MVISITLTIIAVIIIAITIRRQIVKGYSTVSFKESMDLTELPIITVQSNNIKINLLLDTGSNASYISPHTLENLKYEELGINNTTFGFGGTSEHSKACKIEFKYKNLTFEDTFIIMQSDDIFSAIKNAYGVHIHGIIGSRFFETYRYVLDFKDFIAYIK